MTMNPPPPGPATNGLVTPSVLAVATAASMAFPPCRSTSMPARLAPRSMDATAPPVPTATACFCSPAAARTAAGRGRAAANDAVAPAGEVIAAGTLAMVSAARPHRAETAGRRRMRHLRGGAGGTGADLPRFRARMHDQAETLARSGGDVHLPWHTW